MSRDTQYHGWSHPFIFHFVVRIPSSHILCSTYSLLQGLIGNKEIFLITFSHLLLFPQISNVVNDNKSLIFWIIEKTVFKRCLYSINYSYQSSDSNILFFLTWNTFFSKERETIFVFYPPLSCKITFFMNFQPTIGNGKGIKIP